MRILLCDDHAVVRAGLLALLSSAPGIEVVGEAGGGEEAVVLAARLRPDVVLMDLQLGPGMDGIEATRRIVADAAAGTGTPTGSGSGGSGSGSGSSGGPYVLVLTTYDTDADITRAIDAGATGYLLKAERPEELFSAIRAAAEGRTALSPPVAGRVMARMRGSVRPALTDRERDILGQLARGLGNREIARALFISEATVKTHLGRIYDKLGVDTRSGAVAVAKEQRLLP
ncbi:response regulator transcription factor [Streptomyces roseifaciens]